jgi:8-oxo-dGTP diphosphatase
VTEKKQESIVLAGAATVCGGKFLLLKRSRRESFLPEVWGIPAGRVRHCEDPEKACVRELDEETGLKGEVVHLVGYSTFRSKRDGIELSNVQLNFLVRVDECDAPDALPDVTLNKTSHSAWEWISLKDTGSKLLDAFTREIMMSVRDYSYREAALPRLAHR